MRPMGTSLERMKETLVTREHDRLKLSNKKPAGGGVSRSHGKKEIESRRAADQEAREEVLAAFVGELDTED